MINFFVGRKKELSELSNCFYSENSFLFSIVGRRGVGKTFLINKFQEELKNREKEKFICLNYVGRKNLSKQKQIDLFVYQTFICLDIDLVENKKNKFKEWFEVFNFLKQMLKEEKRKILLVIDEFAWFHTKGSNFAEEFGIFWNDIKNQNNIFALISGSAISWMNKNVFYSKGSLYHKVTKVLRIKPFNFNETKEYFYKKSFNFSQDEVIQYYLLTGGVVRYLDKIRFEHNLIENIQNIFNFYDLEENNEFSNLFESTFNSNKTNIHKEIINLFSYKNQITVDFIQQKLKHLSLQTIYSALKDLVVSNILLKIDNIKDKNKPIYILIDLFCFYNVKLINKNNSLDIFNKDLLDKYNGYAFEIFAFLNIDFIKEQIGKSGIKTTEFKFQNENTQIDLIIDYGRNDYSIVECKFYNKEFSITKDYEFNLINKREEFVNFIKNKNRIKKYNVNFIFVSLNGLNPNSKGRLLNLLEVKIND